MDKLLVLGVILALVVVGSSQNCQFILYNGTDNDSVVCVRMNITAEFKIGYNKTVDNTTESTTATIPVDCNADVSGYCSESIIDNYDRAAIELTWGDNEEYVLTYTFIANYDNRKWNISEVRLSVDVNEAFDDVIPEAGIISGTRNKGLIGDINFKKSYYCESNKKFDFTLNSTANNESIYFTMSAKISEFKIQAFEFNNATSGEYQNSARCSQDVKGSDIVAIAVGTAVAGGLVIFIISITAFYIIACWRSRKKSSYEALI